MNRVQLSARKWRTEQDVHDALARALQFPGYYGRNLDALFDCLRELTDTQLVIEDCAFAAEHLPQWKVCRLEGTYLPWVDISALGITAQAYADRLLSEAKVWVNPGTMYGPQTGEGYIRLNIACPRSRLMEALERIASIKN